MSTFLTEVEITGYQRYQDGHGFEVGGRLPRTMPLCKIGRRRAASVQSIRKASGLQPAGRSSTVVPVQPVAASLAKCPAAVIAGPVIRQDVSGSLDRTST